MSSGKKSEILEDLERRLVAFSGKEFLLTPINMVPNGPPHLGHISGPLLRMDIVRRHLKRLGATVHFITTTDVHETHVEVKAREQNRTNEEVANDYHDQIHQDLSGIDIEYDDLINPLDPKWAGLYQAINDHLFEIIAANGHSSLRIERLPFREDTSELVLGGWLAGTCPNCGSELVSFFCEQCGNQSTASELVNPHHRLENIALKWREEKSLFLDLPEDISILDQLKSMKIRFDFLQIAQRFIEGNGQRFRLSLPGKWGATLSDDGLTSPSVSFSYSTAIVAAQILSGEAYKQLTGKDTNPFVRDSNITIVSSFGIDNAVPMLVGVVGVGLAQEEFRPADRYLVNYFYTLNGEKFSTNRQHAIWASDICLRTSLSTDLFRAHMVRRNPEFELSDFDLDDFERESNRFLNACQNVLLKVEQSLQTSLGAEADMPDDIGVAFHKALRRQTDALDLDDFHLSGALNPIQSWIEAMPAMGVETAHRAYWLAKCLAFLAEPVMPKFGQWLWSQLTSQEVMDGATFLECASVARLDLTGNPLGEEVTRERLARCLPGSLATAVNHGRDSHR